MASPFDITDLAATVISRTSIGLTWTYTNGIITQRIAIQRSVGGSFYQTINYVWYPTVSLTVPNLLKNTQYSFRLIVEGLDEFGNHFSPSNVATEYTLPGTISGLTATKVSQEGKVDLAWTNDGTYSHVNVQYKKTSAPAWTSSNIAFAASYQVTGLEEGIEYSFRVRSYSSTSTYYGAYSSTATATTDLIAPTGLAATCPAGTTVRLTWNDNSGYEDGYEIYRDGVLVQTTAADVETWDNTGLTASTTYEFKVRAKRGSVYSNYTSTVTITTGVPPGTPALDSATKNGSFQIDLAYTLADATETGVEIWRSLDDATYTIIDTAGAGTSAYSDTTCDSNTKYYYKIRAINDSGQSGYSSSKNATTDPDLEAPTGLTLEVVSDTQIRVTYVNQSDDAVSHEIWRETTAPAGSVTAYALLATVTLPTVTYLDGTCFPSTTYHYKVRAKKDGSTFSSYCSEVEATTEGPGTENTRRNETYFAFGNSLCLTTEEKQNVRPVSYSWTSKPMDFTDQDPQCHNRFKVVDQVTIEYEDKSTDIEMTVGISVDHGETWTEESVTFGTSDGTQKSQDFLFVPICSKYFQFRITHTSADKEFAVTGMYAYYQLRGEYFE